MITPSQRRAPPHRARRCLSVCLSICLFVCLSACALPGSPRPQTPPTPSGPPIEPTACPSLTLIGGSDEGLRLDVTLPVNPTQDAAGLPSHFVLLATADGVTATERMVIRLDGRLDPLRRAGGTLPLLDAAWPQDASTALSLRAQLIFPARDADDDAAPSPSPCEVSAWRALPAVSAAAWPVAPISPPVLDPLGRAVTLRLPDDARDAPQDAPRQTWRILRRALSDTESQGEVIATGWSPLQDDGLQGSRVFVDVQATPGGVYAYSVAREVEVFVAHGEPPLLIVSARSPEGYAVLALPPAP